MPWKDSRCPPVPVAGRPRYRRPKEQRDRRRNVTAQFPMPAETRPLRPKDRSIIPKPLDLEMWNLQTREQQDGSLDTPPSLQLLRPLQLHLIPTRAYFPPLGTRLVLSAL